MEKGVGQDIDGRRQAGGRGRDMVVGGFVTGSGIGGAPGFGYLIGEITFLPAPGSLEQHVFYPVGPTPQGVGLPVGAHLDPDIADGHRCTVILLDDHFHPVGEAGGVQAVREIAGGQAAVGCKKIGHFSSFRGCGIIGRGAPAYFDRRSAPESFPQYSGHWESSHLKIARAWTGRLTPRPRGGSIEATRPLRTPGP